MFMHLGDLVKFPVAALRLYNGNHAEKQTYAVQGAAVVNGDTAVSERLTGLTGVT